MNGTDNILETQTKKTLQSYRRSSTTIAFTRVSQKPKVMSPQPFPRDVGIKCRNDNRPNSLAREPFNPTKETEHLHIKHSSPERRTCPDGSNNCYRITSASLLRVRSNPTTQYCNHQRLTVSKTGAISYSLSARPCRRYSFPGRP